MTGSYLSRPDQTHGTGGYSEDDLRSLWDTAPFSLRVLRPMNQTTGHGPYFGQDFLWALLATREGTLR
jgi:hypothetical protein